MHLLTLDAQGQPIGAAHELEVERAIAGGIDRGVQVVETGDGGEESQVFQA